MCSCINILGDNGFFGRNMDLDHSFNEKVIITPRNYIIKFKKEKQIENHYAFIGIGTIINDYPLYAEASNENGLSIANLNFKNLAKYHPHNKEKKNYAIYEICLLLLSKCKSVKEAKKMLKDVNVLSVPFNENTPLTDLHIMVSDSKESIVIETDDCGFNIYDNDYNVLTNNPNFPYHRYNVSNYMYLDNNEIKNSINPKVHLNKYSLGLSSFGLPGDYSSTSRFVRAFFNKSKVVFPEDNKERIITYFKLLDSVSIIKGCVKTSNGYHYSRYASCFSYNDKSFYYKTYYSNEIVKINMFNKDLSQNKLIAIELREKVEFTEENN